MLTKFADMCEMILEDNKSDMKILKDGMSEKFGLKSNNFSDQTVLPDGTVRMRVVAPGDKQFIDDVFFVDIKSGKYTINGLTKQDIKANSSDDLFKVISAPTDEEPETEEEPDPNAEPESDEHEEKEPESDEEEKNGKPELEDEPTETEEPEEKPEEENPEEDEFEKAEKKKKKEEDE